MGQLSALAVITGWTTDCEVLDSMVPAFGERNHMVNVSILSTKSFAAVVAGYGLLGPDGEVER